MKVSPARVAAFDVLLKIERDRAHSSIELAEAEESLSDKDKALCHQLVLGVLRRKLYLDEVIRKLGGARRLDPEVATALRIGLFQVLFLDRIPGYSAVNDSVNLVQRARKTSAKGFVNALLRRAEREGVVLELADDASSVSNETSHPLWLIRRWSEKFGPAEAEAIAAANNVPSVNSFRATVKGDRNGVDPFNFGTPSGNVSGAFTALKLTTELREMTRRGEVYFQDEGSQLVASLVEVPRGGRFLDVCAAPGGKTGMIGWKLAGQNISITAGDLHWRRVELLRSNCLNQGIEGAGFVQYDAALALPFADESFDSILLDAPCSGTGTIRNNPEIRYFLRPEDIPDLQTKQLAILENASKLVRAGGRIVYSTCSLEPEENEEVIEIFLKRADEFCVIKPEIAERYVTPSGYVRTFPARDNMDGFFASVLERRQ